MKWFFSILYFSAGGFHHCHFIMKNGAFFLEPKVISWEENSSRIIIHRKPHSFFSTLDKCTSCHCVVYCGSAPPPPPPSPLRSHTGGPIHLASHIEPSAVPLLKTLPWSLILFKSFSQNVALMVPEALTVDEVWKMLEKSAVKEGFSF